MTVGRFEGYLLVWKWISCIKGANWAQSGELGKELRGGISDSPASSHLFFMRQKRLTAWRSSAENPFFFYETRHLWPRAFGRIYRVPWLFY